MSPVAKIASRLRRRWDAEDAIVLADWCEEHGLISMARQLRRGPNVRGWKQIFWLAIMLGCRSTSNISREGTVTTFDDWAAGQRGKATRLKTEA